MRTIPNPLSIDQVVEMLQIQGTEDCKHSGITALTIFLKMI